MSISKPPRHAVSALLSAIFGVVCLLAMVACLVLAIKSFLFAMGSAESFGVLLTLGAIPVAIAFGVLTLVFMVGLFVSLDLYTAAMRRNRGE